MLTYAYKITYFTEKNNATEVYQGEAAEGRPPCPGNKFYELPSLT